MGSPDIRMHNQRDAVTVHRQLRRQPRTDVGDRSHQRVRPPSGRHDDEALGRLQSEVAPVQLAQRLAGSKPVQARVAGDDDIDARLVGREQRPVRWVSNHHGGGRIRPWRLLDFRNGKGFGIRHWIVLADARTVGTEKEGASEPMQASFATRSYCKIERSRQSLRPGYGDGVSYGRDVGEAAAEGVRRVFIDAKDDLDAGVSEYLFQEVEHP